VTTKRWAFFRAGGFDQVKLESGSDLMHLGELDQKLWVALACPTSGLELDPRTLALIDTDKDGRVRASELINAATFACRNLKNSDDLLMGGASLSLSAINDTVPEGKTLLSAARQILDNIGKPEATAITVEDVSDPARIFAESAFNGDGVITELSTDPNDEVTRAVIREIMDHHLSGQRPGSLGPAGDHAGEDRDILHRGAGIRRLVRDGRGGRGARLPAGTGGDHGRRDGHRGHSPQGERLLRALPPGCL
jgi:hypothetical protein